MKFGVGDFNSLPLAIQPSHNLSLLPSRNSLEVPVQWIDNLAQSSVTLFPMQMVEEYVVPHKDDPWMPLYLASIAGLSTCLGAAVVFVHPKNANNHRVVSPNTMSFSLALAGSVMITVSVISLGPECLVSDSGGFVSMEEFFQRFVSFCIGGLLYFLLSWFAFPEPEELIEMELIKQSKLTITETVSTLSSFLDEEYDDPETAIKQGNRENSAAVVMRSRRKDEMNGKTLSHDPRSNDYRSGDVNLLTQRESANTETEGKFRTCKKSEDNVNELGQETPPKTKEGFSITQWSSGADLGSDDQRRAWRVAMLLFVSLMLHNFPEGLAVAASALESRKLGITVTIGIMIHNIPEGIAIAVPCIAARPDSPWLGFALASLSGLAEPMGAFVALHFLRDVSEQQDKSSYLNMENILAFVAGIMIMVALYELFPEAKRHTSLGDQHLVAGAIAGVVIMIATELNS